jgi:hypothetical protein
LQTTEAARTPMSVKERAKHLNRITSEVDLTKPTSAKQLKVASIPSIPQK